MGRELVTSESRGRVKRALVLALGLGLIGGCDGGGMGGAGELAVRLPRLAWNHRY
jgi:hypothetical protein